MANNMHASVREANITQVKSTKAQYRANRNGVVASAMALSLSLFTALGSVGCSASALTSPVNDNRSMESLLLSVKRSQDLYPMYAREPEMSRLSDGVYADLLYVMQHSHRSGNTTSISETFNNDTALLHKIIKERVNISITAAKQYLSKNGILAIEDDKPDVIVDVFPGTFYLHGYAISINSQELMHYDTSMPYFVDIAVIHEYVHRLRYIYGEDKHVHAFSDLLNKSDVPIATRTNLVLSFCVDEAAAQFVSASVLNEHQGDNVAAIIRYMQLYHNYMYKSDLLDDINSVYKAIKEGTFGKLAADSDVVTNSRSNFLNTDGRGSHRFGDAFAVLFFASKNFNIPKTDKALITQPYLSLLKETKEAVYNDDGGNMLKEISAYAY